MNLVFALLAGLAVTEGGLAVLVAWLRRGCPWLITRRDMTPPIDAAGLDRFMAHGWDTELGWIRKANTEHDEIGHRGIRTRYHIDEDGARVNPGFQDLKPFAVAYGDSYTFCRQVNDNQTWPHFLSQSLNANVCNKGVGNYGLDQALLRAEREAPANAKVLIMGVVPETICRVHSVWKNFSEYGNVFAFKPRFSLTKNGVLELIPNPVPSRDWFFRIPEILPRLKQNDFFFEKKFQRDILHFSYIWRLARTWSRNGPLIIAALKDKMSNDGKRAFCQVMERNIDTTATLYSEPEPRALIEAITHRFAQTARDLGAEPVLLMLPQLYDLPRLRKGDAYYRPFLEEMSKVIHVVDLGPVLVNDNNDSNNYIDDRFGGHLTARGNALVADTLHTYLMEHDLVPDNADSKEQKELMP